MWATASCNCSVLARLPGARGGLAPLLGMDGSTPGP
jgi:hypothetical protein